MAVGICRAVLAASADGTPRSPTDPAARDIRFEIDPGVASPPPDQMNLKGELERALYAIQRLFPGPAEESRFRPFFVQILSIAQVGLVGSNASPDVARPALASTVADLIDDEGGKIKNRHLRALAITACALSVPPLLAYAALRFIDAGGGPLHAALTTMAALPGVLAGFMMLWVGCFTGVVLSYGARTTTMTLADLISPTPDRLLPMARLLFAGTLTMVFGLLLSMDLVEIKLGGVSSRSFARDPMLAFLVGVACGMSQLALPSAVTRRIGEILPLKP